MHFVCPHNWLLSQVSLFEVIPHWHIVEQRQCDVSNNCNRFRSRENHGGVALERAWKYQCTGYGNYQIALSRNKNSGFWPNNYQSIKVDRNSRCQLIFWLLHQTKGWRRQQLSLGPEKAIVIELQGTGDLQVADGPSFSQHHGSENREQDEQDEQPF